ncbi:LysR family transcriptional regulator [Paenibacillus aestuarii]|uniref:LysR family transcriptional regulator n=1 Tax=Paenibacillus aestuarii TaxID=516965 RepID=A0ABW0KIZ2_9BACL|nr:LysR family transcriptional regulator [Paenibacillus aestuarii]
MDLKTLETFHLIVKHESFHRAAEELNYAQSTVTMQIQKLEATLGVQLLERGKSFRLTEAGRLFYEQSQEIIQRMKQLTADMTDMQHGEAGTVRLGVTEPTASHRLPPLIRRFITRYPRIRISLDIASTPALAESLLQGRLDFAICSPPDVGTELYFEPLFLEKFVALLPEHHPLSALEAVEPQHLQGHRLLITSAICPYRRKLEMILQEAGPISVETMEIGSMTALKSYVAAGLGMALVPEILLHPMPPGTTARSISGPQIDLLSGLMRKTGNLSPASAKLYHFLKQELLP